MSFIGQLPDTKLTKLVVNGSQEVNNIVDKISLTPLSTNLVTDKAVYDFVRTTTVDKFNSSFSNSNIVNAPLNQNTTKTQILKITDPYTLTIDNTDFIFLYENSEQSLPTALDLTIVQQPVQNLTCTSSTMDRNVLQVTFDTQNSSKFQSLDTKLVAFKAANGAEILGRFKYLNNTSGKIFHVQFFNNLSIENQTLNILNLFNITLDINNNVRYFNGNITRSNTQPEGTTNDLWYNLSEKTWYFYNQGWNKLNGFLLGYVTQTNSGLSLCLDIDSQKLLPEFNNIILQFNNTTSYIYHDNPHITINDVVSGALTNNRINWQPIVDTGEQTYYLYINKFVNVFAEKTKPIYKNNTSYKCHPYNDWRCLGYCNTVDRKIINIHTYDSDFWQPSLEQGQYDPDQILVEINGLQGGSNITGIFTPTCTGEFEIMIVGGGGGNYWE